VRTIEGMSWYVGCVDKDGVDGGRSESGAVGGESIVSVAAVLVSICTGLVSVPLT